MSVFDFPRVNVKGTVQLNPGTANNDDYAGAVTLPADWGPFAGETLALVDSKRVEARTYGMSDEAFIAWAQKAQTFDVSGSPGQTKQIIPAEWNYYGSMSSKTLSVKVVGVQAGPGEVHGEPAAGVPLTGLLGAGLSFSGWITDLNSEGSPPATQFFLSSLSLSKDGTTFLSGSAGAISKAACQWINFYRNVNLTADGGAGGYMYHVIYRQGDNIAIPGYEDPRIVGVVFRYYFYRTLIGETSNAAIEALYASGKTNPATLEIVGTFAPLFAEETLLTGPAGRLLVSNTAAIPTPEGTRNNSNGFISLAPAVLGRRGDLLSADFSGTFPDYYQNGQNPKFNFGPVSLMVSNGEQFAEIGRVEYEDGAAGDRRGWVFDFDLSANAAAQQVLKGGDPVFQLVQPFLGAVLEEADYYFASNQQAIYAEQKGSGAEFLNQGTAEPATVAVYHRGQELAAGSCPPITVWQYRSIPLQAPGNAEPIFTGFQPGQPLVVDTSQPGNFLFTFTINDGASPAPAGYPPRSYSQFMFPPYITNAPAISLRILPNGEDFGRYYVDPGAAEPVGNDLLTFDVVYRKVLRTYYLLFPAMNQIFPLNDEQQVAKNAQAILNATDPAIWMTSGYMPRTRDMSATRHTLLQAWCRKVLQGG